MCVYYGNGDFAIQQFSGTHQDNRTPTTMKCWMLIAVWEMHCLSDIAFPYSKVDSVVLEMNSIFKNLTFIHEVPFNQVKPRTWLELRNGTVINHQGKS
jgi:hypothetical protein